ncbi:thiamine pyrophosphate-binding protein [Brucella abortus]|nr:thiamine pyrophosphate-binding protein [Brucella abortus]
MVIQALIDQGVESIFGYPGGAVLPIYDELFQQDQIQHVLVRHEQGAGHAAEGYARSTGKVGVMLVTSGPGANQCRDAVAGCLDGSHPAGLHFRSGSHDADRFRCVSGMRYDWHHAPLHQAQLAGKGRQRPVARPA